MARHWHSHLKSTTVNPSNIRDRNGAIILPCDYSLKLDNQAPVFVTVKLRLYVLSLSYFFKLVLNLSARWEIPQSEEKRAISGFKFTNCFSVKCHYSPATFLRKIVFLIKTPMSTLAKDDLESDDDGVGTSKKTAPSPVSN